MLQPFSGELTGHSTEDSPQKDDSVGLNLLISTFAESGHNTPWPLNCSRLFMQSAVNSRLFDQISVAEVAPPGEHHRDTVVVGGGDDLFVPDRPARLDDRRGAGSNCGIEPVSERKERIARTNGSTRPIPGAPGGELR
jgi:hypothetical protein